METSATFCGEYFFVQPKISIYEFFQFQLVAFIGWFCSSLALINRIELGLDQTLSMPDVRILFYRKAVVADNFSFLLHV